MSTVQQKIQLTDKTWGLVALINGETFHSFHREVIGELLAKNMARTARRKLDGRHLLFGQYLQNWTTLYLLNLTINMHALTKMNLTSMDVHSFFFKRIYFIRIARLKFAKL